jgi:hypothetical protein
MSLDEILERFFLAFTLPVPCRPRLDGALTRFLDQASSCTAGQIKTERGAGIQLAWANGSGWLLNGQFS